MAVTGVLVTGGAGFIGSHLAEKYLKAGIPVVCVDNFVTGMKSNFKYLSQNYGNKVTLVEADVTESWTAWEAQATKAASKISHVFHFASPASPPLYQESALETLWVNSVGLKNALEFADRFSARAVFASTSEVYGDPDVSPQPESFWGNVNSFGVRSCYDEAKRFGEALIFTWNLKKKTNHGLVRIFNTYGPRMNPEDGRVVVNFLVQALKGEALTIYGDGKQTRSFCYIDDLVDGITKYAENSSLQQPMNLGNDKEFTILELTDVVKKIFPEKKLQVIKKVLPQDDPKQRRPDLTFAKKTLPAWSPKTDLATGLKKMAEWLSNSEV